MSGITDFIVCLWFLPVTLFIIVPLGMLCAWSLARLANPVVSKSRTAETAREEGEDVKMYSSVRA